LNELDEWREEAYKNSKIYKKKVKCWHDKHILQNREFKKGYQVLLFNSTLRLFPGKLHSRWSGSFVVRKVFPFVVNGNRLKIYYGKDMGAMERVDTILCD
jgi:hypothetical protein